MRKALDGVLMKMLPASWWRSLYSMVTFSNVGYAIVRRREERLSAIVERGAWAVGVGMAVAITLGVNRTQRVWRTVVKGWVESIGAK